MFMVEDAITNPTSPTQKEAIMWNDLSPVASECLWSCVNLLCLQERGRTYLVIANATRVANTQGGAQSRRVTVVLYLSVAVRVGKNAPNEREVVIQAKLHAAAESNTLSGSAENDVLQCHVYNLPIRQGINERLPLTLDFGLFFIANTGVLFHSLLSQSDLDRG
jgi:hypothetical protein